MQDALISLRPATDADKPFLTWLEEACMRDYAVALWGVWRPRPDEAFTLDGHRILVAGDRDVGCVAASRLPDHVWVDKLYVAPAVQNRGIGTTALGFVMAEAAAEGVPVRLSVLATNPALAFYLRHGLNLYDETPERRYLTTSAPRRPRWSL